MLASVSHRVKLDGVETLKVLNEGDENPFPCTMSRDILNHMLRIETEESARLNTYHGHALTCLRAVWVHFSLLAQHHESCCSGLGLRAKNMPQNNLLV